MGLIPFRPRQTSGEPVIPGEITRTERSLVYGDGTATGAVALGPWVDVRRFDVVPDCDLAVGTSSGTNWQTVLQAAANELPAGWSLYFPPAPQGYGYKTGELEFSKPIGVIGAGGHGPLVPAADIDSSAGVLNWLYSPSEPSNTENHLQRPTLRDIAIYGFDRTVSCHGIVMDQVHGAYLSNVRVDRLAGSALKHVTSCRESVAFGFNARYCGTASAPALDMEDLGSLDGHNNLRFLGCQIIYSVGVPILVRDGGSTVGGVRGIKFTDLMAHGDDETNFHPLFLVDSAGPVIVTGQRLHAPGPGQPLGRCINNGHLRVSDASMSLGAEVFNESSVPLASNVFTFAGHTLGTGAVVRVDNGSELNGTQDRFVIRLDDNTFSVATSYANAVAGTAETLTDDATAEVVSRRIGFDLNGPNGHLFVSNSYAPASQTWAAGIVNRTGDSTRAGVALSQHFTADVES